MSGAVTGIATAPVQSPITIDFTEIPYNLQVPGTYAEVKGSLSNQGLLSYPTQGVILAPKLAAGTLAELAPVPCYGLAQAQAAFGLGSIGSRMASAWYASNPYSPLSLLAVPDAVGATASVWNVTISLASLGSGTLPFYVDGVPIPVTVTAGIDSADTICANLVAAINALPDCPVSAVVNATTLSEAVLTSKNLGAATASLSIATAIHSSDVMPAGLTVAIAATPGSGVPDLAAAWAAVSGQKFTHAGLAYSDLASLVATSVEMERRFNAMVGLDCVAFAWVNGTLSDLLAAAAAVNGRFVYLLGGPGPLPSPWSAAASAAANAAFYLGQDPGRQLRGIPLVAVPAAPANDQFDPEERNALLTGGVATTTLDPTGTLRIERMVSTYTTNAQGIPDPQWHDITQASVAIRVRYDWVNFAALQWPRPKLAPDGSLAAAYDPQVVTPRRIWSSWASRSRLYEQQGWIVNSAATAAQSVFQLDPSNSNRVNARQVINVIGNLMILAGQIEVAA
jgi:phage tail sheath gpL-like